MLGLVFWIALLGGRGGVAEHELLVDVRETMASTPALDPDEPRFEFAFQGARARAMLGGQVGIWGARLPRVDFALAVSPFFELVNFFPSPIPWQSFRANVGVNTLWRPALHGATDVVVQAGVFHESDHVASIPSYEQALHPDPRPVDNGNFSAFEYFKLKVDVRYDWSRVGAPRLTTVWSPGVRVFTPSINPGDLRSQTVSVQGEVRARVRITPQLAWWAAAYGDLTHNRFSAAANGFAPGPRVPANPTPFVTRRLATGLTVQGRTATQVVPQIGYENSNGRGVDFMRWSGHTLMVALAVFR